MNLMMLGTFGDHIKVWFHSGELCMYNRVIITEVYTMMTYAEFKRLDVYKTADVVEIFDENGIEIDDSVTEEELNEMDVKAYFVKGGWLTLELGESIVEFE